MLLVLAREPRWLAAMREEVPLRRRFIEEILRLAAPAQGLFRIARRDTSLGGVQIPARSVLSLRFAAANRDPGRFPEPEKIRLDRPTVPPHLAFGAGIHFCIGAPLARRELLVALEQLVEKFESIELAVPPDSLQYTQSVTTRGLLALPIVVARRESGA
jgi:cytochrome P450